MVSDPLEYSTFISDFNDVDEPNFSPFTVRGLSGLKLSSSRDLKPLQMRGSESQYREK